MLFQLQDCQICVGTNITEKRIRISMCVEMLFQNAGRSKCDLANITTKRFKLHIDINYFRFDPIAHHFSVNVYELLLRLNNQN